jgi:hypothetical protein
LSRGVERSMTASNVSATPPGSAIHPRLRKAETVEREFVGRAKRAGKAVAVGDYQEFRAEVGMIGWPAAVAS